MVIRPNLSTPAEQLFHKLLLLDRKFGLNLEIKGCEEAVARAVWIANKDIENFGSEDSAYFLESTRRLIAETESTHGQMERFFENVAPENIFQSFHGHPGASELQGLQARAKENISKAKAHFKKD